MKTKQINYTVKPISEFTENDTLYMQKHINGYIITFLLKFKSFNKGNNIIGEIIEIQPNDVTGVWLNKVYVKIGDDLTGRISTCYTYSNTGCKWFNKSDKNIWNCV